MFRAGFQAEQKARQAVAQTEGGAVRQVPQWLFLSHLFNNVILADANARAASGSSTNTSLVKRLLIGSVAGLCVIYSGLQLWSYSGNHDLEQNVLTAARAIPSTEGSSGAVPDVDSLKHLEELRTSLADLTEYEHVNKPLLLRFGLYQGTDMLPDVRKIYYAKFRQLLFGATQQQLVALLQRVPATPGPNDDYDSVYDTLKAYLLTTSQWQKSSDAGLQSFLRSRLYAGWTNGRTNEIGETRLNLAKRQYDFYASDLHNGNPYPDVAHDSAVPHSRAYLLQFPGTDRVYRGLLALADKKYPPTSFNQNFQGSAVVVTSAEPVRGAFTKEGAKLMQDAIRNQDFKGEDWVLGPGGRIPDKAKMEKGLMDRYSDDYIAQWRNVLKKSNVNGYGNLKDAANKLNILTGNTAPLLALFWWTSWNTCVDVPGVADKFKAPQTVVPCPTTRIYIVDANKPYNVGLQALQQAVERAAEPSANKEALRDSEYTATSIARQLGSSFPPDTDEHLLDLLLQPIKHLDGLGSSDLKEAGERFCSDFKEVTQHKFPFDPQSKVDAKQEDLAGLLRPNSGTLWKYYQGSLKSVMQCANGECSPTGGTQLNSRFTQFIGNLMKFSHALYGDAGTEMSYQYTLTPKQTDQVEEFQVTVNGDTAKIKGGVQHSFTWPGGGTRNFGLSLRLAEGGTMNNATYPGPWAAFHFFHGANRNIGNVFSWSPVNGTDQMPITSLGRPLTYDIVVSANGPVVFSKDFLSSLQCAVPVAH